MGASRMLLYEAFSLIGVGIGSLLYCCGPVIVMALSPLFFKERPAVTKVFGFFAVLCGILLINAPAFGGSGNIFGIFCGIMSAVTYAVMVIANKKSRHITGLENTVLQLITGFLTVAAFVGFKDGFSMHINGNDWIRILILGFLNTGVGCYLYFASISKLPVQPVAICGYTEPLCAVVSSAIILREQMLAVQISGAALIIGGAVFCECFISGKQKPCSIETKI